VTGASPVVYERPADEQLLGESEEATRVVFVHGSMDRGGSFLKAARRLRDLDVVRYDRAGYGRSVALAPAPSFDAHVAELADVIGARPAVVVGHSLGGLIALGAAAAQPDAVTAVVAYASPSAWAVWWPTQSAGGEAGRAADEGGPGDAAERFMRRMIGDERWERLPPSTREARRAEGVALVSELLLVRGGPPPFDLTDVRCPVVPARGTESVAHQRRSADELAAAMPGHEVVVIDGAGHGAHFSHPDEFADLVRRALVVSSSRRSVPPAG
jgi:pimeloyl-ACP methyl ester carboxylesterase